MNFKDKKAGEIIRFGIVGSIAVGIQYATFLLLCRFLSPVVANTMAYFISFCFNFIASSRFTFHSKVNIRHTAGFTLCHIVNYLLQSGLLWLFLWYGITKYIALVPVLTISVPINFILVRFVLKK